MNLAAQESLFGEGRMTPPARSATPDPLAIRARLNRLMDILRTSETMPLSDRDQRMWQIVLPNMTRWLPDEEAHVVRAEFTSQMERLRAGNRHIAGSTGPI